MSEVTPLNILNHEIIGLQTHIVGSRDPTHICRDGTIIAETKEMIQLGTSEGDILIPKDICVFQLTLPDGTTVQVDGNLLHGRPEDRMKKHHGRK